jgi:peptide/nickel transport system substrate-binding protein
VVYSFQRVLKLGQGPAAAFKPVVKPENITKTDDTTVQFVLDKPYAPFLSTMPLVAVLNSKLLKTKEEGGDWGSKWLASNEAGSGAYTIDTATYRPQENVDLKRFEGHFKGWSDNPSPVSIVRAKPIKETSTRVLALIKGDTDATDSYLPTDQVERVAKAKGVRVARDESMRVMVIRMNNAKAPFDNINFRKCLSYAFNYKGFISGILKDYAVRNAGPIPKNLWGAPADLAGYEYDPKKAAEFCEKAKAEGAPTNREVEIHIQSELDQTVQAAQLLQADMRKLGVTVKIVPSTWPQLTSSMGKSETTPDMWVHWVSTYFVDPENWIGQMYDSQFAGTWKASSWYKNPKLDGMLGEARSIVEQDKRKALYEQASKLVVDDAVDIWIYNTIQLRGLTDRVQGYKFSPVGSGGEVRWMSLKN